MKICSRYSIILIFVFVFSLGIVSPLWGAEMGKTTALFAGVSISAETKAMLDKNGFVVVPGGEKEIYAVYEDAKEKGQPIFVTTDAVLHTAHTFFDYLLRIVEIEKLNDALLKLLDRMITSSLAQFNEASDPSVKEAARLNVGYFSVAKKLLDPSYKVEPGLDGLVQKEITEISEHKGLAARSLLTYVENPYLYGTPYAFEDYSQYVPRGHYTRNETFERYFMAMMWLGRIDFKLRPGKANEAKKHGDMMTLQALLMADALMKDKDAFALWKQIYEPTAYFVGKADDLDVYDYHLLMRAVFPAGGTVDKYSDATKRLKFIDEAMKLRPPKILSGAAFVEDGSFGDTTKGFRFMGQRFIPDSYIFQNLVFGVKDLGYTGSGKPFTMEVVPGRGAVRAFPRGLDVFAVLGSERALEILKAEGDTDYSDYSEQLNLLRNEFASKKPEEWRQNLYWRWLYSLLPLLEKKNEGAFPAFMTGPAWLDKELGTALGSWAELRHDTILYGKQSYTMLGKSMPPEPKKAYGYVEPYPEVYGRLAEMMSDLRGNLTSLGVSPEGVPEKLEQFENLLAQLQAISEKELNGGAITDAEYAAIRNIGPTLKSLTHFSPETMEKITSDADTRMDIVADVHTDPNTRQVLEVAVGSPSDIYVVVEDAMGKRVCRGGVFSFYEFKHPLSDRLTDDRWQEMGAGNVRPIMPRWTESFMGR